MSINVREGLKDRKPPRRSVPNCPLASVSKAEDLHDEGMIKSIPRSYYSTRTMREDKLTGAGFVQDEVDGNNGSVFPSFAPLLGG